MNLIKKNPLFFAFFFPALVDGIVTLLGQDASYWNGGRVNEASPAYYFLIISPWLFAVFSVLWFAFWYWIFKKLKEPFNLFLMFLFIAGHSWGSTSWIWKMMRDNGIYSPNNQVSAILVWGISILYLALVAFFATYSLRIYLQKRRE